ncbi:hypothetical protein [Bosea vaviloviae]|uniref:hypothetical protein n=1 Tax=Bosea vaviloviae TaxID=1526658 RepID=UPI0011DFE710|nr:hypothetical protein [Bosea vaviloviae]
MLIVDRRASAIREPAAHESTRDAPIGFGKNQSTLYEEGTKRHVLAAIFGNEIGNLPLNIIWFRSSWAEMIRAPCIGTKKEHCRRNVKITVDGPQQN